MRLKAELRSREIAVTLTDDGVTAITLERSQVIIINGLGDNRLRTIQDREALKSAGRKLNHRYVARTMLNKLSVLQMLLAAIFSKEEKWRIMSRCWNCKSHE